MVMNIVGCEMLFLKDGYNTLLGLKQPTLVEHDRRHKVLLAVELVNLLIASCMLESITTMKKVGQK